MQYAWWITTNLAFKQWGTVFPGAACVGALVDRFAQHCHRVDIDADSWRDAHAFQRDDPAPDNKAPPAANAADPYTEALRRPSNFDGNSRPSTPPRPALRPRPRRRQ